MKTSNWLKELPFAVLIAIPWMLIVYLGNRLPAQVPSHYSITNNGWVIDSYMSPIGFVTMFTIVIAFIYLVMTLPAVITKATWLYYFKLALVVFFDIIIVCTLTGVDTGTDTFSNVTMILLCGIINGFIYWIFKAGKKSGKQPISTKYYNIIWGFTHFVSSFPLILVVFASFHWMGERMIPASVFLFIAIASNLTNSVKPNHYIGIRTPWTLADENVWRKTHQACSKWFFLSGIAGFVLSMVLPTHWVTRLLLIIPLSCTAYAMIYSYWLYKKRASV